jgi:bifunctional non-homologous end joining protein LigD
MPVKRNMPKTAAQRTPRPAGDSLARYRAKRDFNKTPEPSDESSQTAAETGKKAETARGVFCVQKHDATRLHYDVRIEIRGALMSFAVPKGPSYDPKVKRLAIETEDHPMMYADFEARIPDGQYGAGDMLLWDLGTFETVPPGQEEAQREKGHLHVRFFGEKLRGGWHFVRTKGSGGHANQTERRGSGEAAKAQWLMFKAEDNAADPALDIVAERPESVKSGKSATRGPLRVGASDAGHDAATLAATVGDVARATSGAIDDVRAYLYEIKYDGYRILAVKAGDEVRLITRGGHDWTHRFAVIPPAVRALAAREAVIDGEACVVDDAGRPSLPALQAWLSGERPPEQGKATLAYVAFDLLWLDGRDLRGAKLEERRELLDALLSGARAPLSLSRASEVESPGELAAMIEATRAAGLEGLVAKRKGSTYVAGPTGTWRKVKFVHRQDCVIVGWAPIEGATNNLGSLLLAVTDPDGGLRYVGRVGTGFDARTREKLLARLSPSAVQRPPVEAPRMRDAHWVTPSLVCEVEYADWSRDRVLLRSSFVALREDKTPDECTVDDRPTSASAAPADAPRPSPPNAKLPALSNPAKVLFPRDAIAKREILDYYLAIAPALLPHLASRPLTLQRWPDGIDGEAWYQQNPPAPLPPFVHFVPVERKKRLIADNVETLAWLANLAALTLHVWSSRVPHLESPDYTILDLDPGDGTWKDVIDVARAIRTLLDALSLDAAIKTSGKRGLHIVVPLAKGPSHAEATAFAQRIADAVAKVLPDVATTERIKEKRKGRLYIDYLQNGEGRTIVAPYTIRALDGAPVSTPLAWAEVTEQLDPRAFTIRTVPARIAKHGDLFAVALSGRGRIA